MKKMESAENICEKIKSFIKGDYRFKHACYEMKYVKYAVLAFALLTILIWINVIIGYVTNYIIKMIVMCFYVLLTKICFAKLHSYIIFECTTDKKSKKTFLFFLVNSFLIISCILVVRLILYFSLQINLIIVIMLSVVMLAVQNYLFLTRPFERQRFLGFLSKFMLVFIIVASVTAVFCHSISNVIVENDFTKSLLLILGIMSLFSLLVFIVFVMSGWSWIQLLSIVILSLVLVFLQDIVFVNQLPELYEVTLRTNPFANFMVNFEVFFDFQMQMTYLGSVVLLVLFMSFIVPGYRLEKFGRVIKVINIAILLLGAFSFFIHPVLYGAIPNARKNAKMSITIDALEEIYANDLGDHYLDIFFNYSEDFTDGGIRRILSSEEVRDYIITTLDTERLLIFQERMEALESFEQQEMGYLIALLVLPLTISFYLCIFIVDLRIKESEKYNLKLKRLFEKEEYLKGELLFAFHDFLSVEAEEEEIELYQSLFEDKMKRI